jgi:CDP-diacylglycerol--glycerol-3-phosphate 3-phosphatidyltransferase
MSLPNAITLSRIPLMFIIAWLTYQGWTGAPSLAFWLFIAAAIGDWLDGYLARSLGQISSFGKLMDALTDKIMVLGLIIVLVDHQQIWVGLALITLVREFLVTGMRMVAASKGVVVAADGGGKSKTITQLIALGFLLAAPMVGRDWSHLLPWDLTQVTLLVHTIGIWIFWVGTALAVWSGVRYIVRHRQIVFVDADR